MWNFILAVEELRVKLNSAGHRVLVSARMRHTSCICSQHDRRKLWWRSRSNILKLVPGRKSQWWSQVFRSVGCYSEIDWKDLEIRPRCSFHCRNGMQFSGKAQITSSTPHLSCPPIQIVLHSFKLIIFYYSWWCLIYILISCNRRSHQPFKEYATFPSGATPHQFLG